MYGNDIAVFKVGSEDSCGFFIKSGVKQGCVISIVILMNFVLINLVKAVGEDGINYEGKNLLDLDFANDLIIVGENEKNRGVLEFRVKEPT